MTVAAVAGLTVLAFLLRLPGIHQFLNFDEFLTRVDIDHGSLGSLLHEVRHGVVVEVSPPLYFVLAWAAAKFGDPLVWMRVPSLVLGTAVIPVIYALGVRTVGTRAALVGAAFATLSPFAIFYSSEGRAYATLLFLCATSTLLLLVALQRGRTRPLWWVAYGAAVCGVLYTHYSGVFLLVTQVLWALWRHRDRWIELVLVHAAALLAFLPWITAVRGDGVQYFGSFTPSVSNVGVPLLGFFPGQPYSAVPPDSTLARALSYVVIPPSELPGTIPLVVLATALGAGLAARVAAALRERRAGRPWLPPAPIGLLALLAASTPVGFFAYSIGAHDQFFSRYFMASLPATVLLAGWLLTSVQRGLMAGALVVAGLGAMSAGLIESLGPEYRRPPFHAAADFIDDHARANQPVVAAAFPPLTSGPLTNEHVVRLGLRPHPVRELGVNDRAVWAHASSGKPVLLVAPGLGPTPDQVPGYRRAGRRFQLRTERRYRGILPLVVRVYTPVADASHRN